MTVADAFFGIFALITAVAAIAAVGVRAEGTSLWWSAVVIAALSGCLLVLQAPTVALSYLLVHLGGVTVLLLTVLRVRRAARPPDTGVPPTGVLSWARLLPVVTAALAAGLVAGALFAGYGTGPVDLTTSAGEPEWVSAAIFAVWWLPLTLVGVTLAVGVTAMLLLTARDGQGD